MLFSINGAASTILTISLSEKNLSEIKLVIEDCPRVLVPIVYVIFNKALLANSEVLEKILYKVTEKEGSLR